MQLHARVTVYVPRPPQAVFEAAVPCENMPSLLKAVGPIPGVIRAELPPGSSLSAGVHRQVFLSDGSKMQEEVLALQPPAAGTPGRHEYRWMHAPAPPFSLLIRSGHALWTFTAERDGTRVDWVYTFEMTTPLVYPLAAPAILLFRRWMQGGLERLRDAK